MRRKKDVSILVAAALKGQLTILTLLYSYKYFLKINKRSISNSIIFEIFQATKSEENIF